jgi:hypothetical protein
MMRMRFFAKVVGCVVLSGTAAAQAPERGPWRAVSKTAKAITGDVAFADTRFSMNFVTFPIAQIRNLQVPEIAAVFDPESTIGAVGTLYRLNIPATTKFLHKNSLCGGEDASYMVTFVLGKTMSVAFFSGGALPVLTPEAIANSTDLCGTFSYER